MYLVREGRKEPQTVISAEIHTPNVTESMLRRPSETVRTGTGNRKPLDRRQQLLLPAPTYQGFPQDPTTGDSEVLSQLFRGQST